MSHATFLHNRFMPGGTTGHGSHSLFAPAHAPLRAGVNVTRVVEMPLFLGADVHSNIGAHATAIARAAPAPR
jgi:hypothetical protein